MYDGIFDDFNTVKRHCKRNGEITFEESAVFELLENLFPQCGSEQAVQIVIEMLDAQRIRDCRDTSNEQVQLEVLHNDKSNISDDSIIEVEVPAKVHPLIDLTDNAHESDEQVIVEKTFNENINSNADNDLKSDDDVALSENDYNVYSDPDISEHFEDDEYNLSIRDTMKPALRKEEPPFMEDFFSILEEPYTSNSNQFNVHQNNCSALEISEMLEENNNDPNNNLDGGILNEESTNNNANFINDGDFENSNPKVFLDEVIEPIPGCSKDTGAKVNIRKNNKGLPSTSIRQSSPVPGCSKDLDDLNNCQLSIKSDESIQNDAICIQEIVPWANLEIIYSILKKHRDSPNRKQLTLWDLMKETTKNKRKQTNDVCTTPNKSLKMETNDDIDESSMDLVPNLQSEMGNESSNDSQSSKISDTSEFSSQGMEKKQNEIVKGIESSKALPLNEQNSNSNTIYLSNELKKINNNLLLDEKSNLITANAKTERSSFNLFNSPVPKMIPDRCQLFIDRPVKKERNETIVSGLLNENSNPHNETKPANNLFFLNPDFLREQSVNGPNLSDRDDKNDTKLNNFSHKYSNNELQEVNKIKNEIEISAKLLEVNRIKKEIEVAANTFFNENFINSGRINFQNVGNATFNAKSDKTDVIKPAKLVIQGTKLQFPSAKPATSTISYIRPATFNYSNSNSETISLLNMQERKSVLKNNHENIPRPTVLQQSNSTMQPAHIRPLKRKPQKPTITDSKRNITNITHNDNQILAPARTVVQSKPLISQLHKVPKVPVHCRVVSIADDAEIAHVQSAIPIDNYNNTLPINLKRVDEVTNGPKSTAIPFPSAESISYSHAQPSSSGMSSTSSNGLFDPTIYSRLRAMFPDVKSSYVKKICNNPPKIMNYNDKELIFNTLVDHLLEVGHNHLEIIENYVAEQTATALSVNEKYEYLLDIFPDADPTYLRDFVEKNCNSDQVLEQFIQQKLETRDYPTIEQYLAKIKITEQQKQYTTDFKVEQFLELFPDPLKHFENDNRQCSYHPIAMEFLKSFFNRNKVSTISRHYTLNKHNLSLTAKALSSLGSDMKSKRVSSEMPTENIPLLQEIAFIKNKQNILNYITTLTTQEEKLFTELREKNLLVTCQCCFNDECMPTKCSECNEGHVFCFECIIRGTESTLADGEAHVKCFTECKSEFSLATLQKVLPPTKFSALLKKRQAAEVMAAEVDGLVSCPFCHFASIPPPEDKVFKCFNPECMKETCRQCKELNHVPLRCDEVIKTDKARHLIEEKMTEALVRKCYKCKRKFYKEDGCNKMTCPCGALMCYLCDKPVNGYAHFNPQGGAQVHLCPLWSDDRRLNAEAVRKVAEDVTKAILKNNPNLKIDTEKLLPKLPPKAKGPHDDIPNANQLPEHVRRLAGAAP